MRLDYGENDEIIVTLSKRNLQTLLCKLDDPLSQRTLWNTFDGEVLLVKAESDELHYPDRRPGPVHPRTEADIEAIRSVEG